MRVISFIPLLTVFSCRYTTPNSTHDIPLRACDAIEAETEHCPRGRGDGVFRREEL